MTRVSRRVFGRGTTCQRDLCWALASASEFYFAEDYHQQYLIKNPHGYCPDHGTGVSCPIGVVNVDAVGLLPADD